MSTVVQRQVRSRRCAFLKSLIRDVCFASTTSCVLFCVCAIFLHLNFHRQWKCLVGSARLRKHDEQRVVEATTTVCQFDNRGAIQYENLVQMIVKRNGVQSQTGIQKT